MQIPVYKKILSYVLPITIEKTIGNNMTVLMLQLYCNQFMLATPRAIYSFGTRYSPYKKPLAQIRAELPRVKNFLQLGTGLGSSLKIIQDKYNLFPDAVLVDNDKDVLRFSLTYMDLNTHNNVEWKCADAVQFLNTNTKKFDLIGVDVFMDLVQPKFICTNDFINQCRQTLQPDGICLFNMILENDNHIIEIEELMKTHFRKVSFILDKVNTYFICHR